VAYAEAVSRLASVRHALRLVDVIGEGPGSDSSQDVEIAAAWPNAGEAAQRLFDRKSGRMVGATAAGLEVLLTERRDGREPHAAASQSMVDEIRRELEQVAGIVLT
jgi:hypothetical protein